MNLKDQYESREPSKTERARRDARAKPVPASQSAAFLELFPTPARTWIVPPNLVLADAHWRRFPPHHSGDVRQLTEGQPCASKVDLSLFPQNSTGRADTS